jgi:hypothetical protein
MKYNLTFQSEFEVTIEADTLEAAERMARKVVAEFPPNTCKLTSVVAHGDDSSPPIH